MFDAPPLDSMTLGQKIGRIFYLSLTLLVICILAAMTFASLLFVLEQGGLKSSDVPRFLTGLGIVLTGFSVNAICVAVLLKIRTLDSKLNLPSKSSRFYP